MFVTPFWASQVQRDLCTSQSGGLKGAKDGREVYWDRGKTDRGQDCGQAGREQEVGVGASSYAGSKPWLLGSGSCLWLLPSAWICATSIGGLEPIGAVLALGKGENLPHESRHQPQWCAGCSIGMSACLLQCNLGLCCQCNRGISFWHNPKQTVLYVLCFLTLAVRLFWFNHQTFAITSESSLSSQASQTLPKHYLSSAALTARYEL